MDAIELLLLRIAERAIEKYRAERTCTDIDDEKRLEKKTLDGGAQIEPQNSLFAIESSNGNELADIAILVALPNPELSQVLSGMGCQWSKEGRDGVLFNVGIRSFSGHPVRIVAAAQNSMGMVPAAILASKTLRAWKPKLLVMTGICAAATSKVALGDVVIAKQVFDYGSGKLLDGVLVPDYEPVAMDEEICGYALDFANDKNGLRQIKDEWPTDSGRPNTDLRVHIGAFASGAAVVADDNVVKNIVEHKRSLLGIDMEAYGIARAAVGAALPTVPFIVVKGVQDHASSFKSDEFREYAAYASVRVLVSLLDRHWGDIRKRYSSTSGNA